MLPNVFGFQSSSPLSFPDSLHLSLPLTLHLSLCLPPSFAKKACCRCTETHVIDISSAKQAFWNPLFIFAHFLSSTNVFLLVFVLFLPAHLFLSLCLSVSLSCRIPEDSVTAISPLSLLRWRDVVTVECSIACQRRHSGWTE